MKRKATTTDKSPRLRPAAASSLLSAALVFSLLGVASSGASVTASGRISAHLTKTSFTAAEAAKAGLSYKFSSESERFAYVLARKNGAEWLKVRSVNTRGSFSGSHTMTVKQLFGPKPVTVGQYRVKVSADANSVSLRFAVITASPGGGASGGAQPQAGTWHSTVLSGPVGGGTVKATNVSFVVLPDRTEVAGFAFGYTYSAPINPKVIGASCSGSGVSGLPKAAPITNGHFSAPSPSGAWTGAAGGFFEGTFDSPTHAHGTAQLSLYIQGPGCFLSQNVSTGTFSWTATR